jgi:hypothetical protein
MHLTFSTWPSWSSLQALKATRLLRQLFPDDHPSSAQALAERLAVVRSAVAQAKLARRQRPMSLRTLLSQAPRQLHAELAQLWAGRTRAQVLNAVRRAGPRALAGGGGYRRPLGVRHMRAR